MKRKTARRKPHKAKLTAEDLYKLRIITAAALSPDETRVVYTVERMDRDERKYYTNIFLYDNELDETRQFTYGNQNDSQPVWSPDGEEIAFVSTRDKKTAIYVMPADGGAERKLIELDGAITNLQYTPDGKHLVLALRYNDSHYIEDEKKKKEQPVYRHITRLYYRLDGSGWRPKDFFQIYALSIADGKLRKITKGNRDNEMPCVSPDGKWIVYSSNHSKDPDQDSLRTDLFLIPFKGGKERKVPTPPGPCFSATFSPDGKTIAYLGHDNPADAWGVTNMHVWKVGVAGKPKARDLMPKYDRHATDSSITDTGDFHGGGALMWSKDGRRLYFLSSDTGVTNVFYVPAGGGKPTRVYKDKCHIKGFSLGKAGKKMAVIRSDFTTPSEIQMCPINFGAEKKAVTLTRLNAFLQKDIKLGRTREVMFKSFDGTMVQGFLVTPPDFRPTKKYPSVLQVHGGPRAQYAFSFFHEMQYLAAKGYVVFYTNPRGGTGRGETWADAIAGGWGDLDYKDCMAAADWMEKQKYIHKKRMGITGGSYGGFMTNWVIGHTNRFKAAVTQRSVVDLVSFFGSSDMGWELTREFDGTPWTNWENYLQCSPIHYYKKVKTPVLIIHSEQDLRCAIEQAEQMFVKLKVLGKKVELVRFPEEPHGLSRHGRPDRRIARLEFMSGWFDKYLKK